MKTPVKASSPGPRQSRSAVQAFLGLALATVLLLSLGAGSAGAAYVQTDEWDLPNSLFAENTQGSLAFDPLSSSLFAGVNSNVAHEITKWTASGSPGTPAAFGAGELSSVNGAAVNPTTHDLYVLSGTNIKTFKSDGTPTGVTFEVGPASGGGIDVDGAGNVFVPEPANKLVAKYDAAGSLVDTFTDPSLNDPRDVGVDSAGNVYVADRSTSPVNEQQKISVKGATEGLYNLSFDGQSTKVTFTGDTHAAKGTADFTRVEGTGDSSLLATGTGDLSVGSTVVTNVSNAGDFTVGESLSTPSYVGGAYPLQAQVTITAIDENAGTITMSRPALNNFPSAILRSGSRVITDVSNINAFTVGMTIAETGSVFAEPRTATIPYAFAEPNTAYDWAATFVTAVDTTAKTITLSSGVTKVQNDFGIEASSVTDVKTTSGAFEPGEVLKGAVLGVGEFISVPIYAVDPGTLQVGWVAEASGDDVSLSAGSDRITDIKILSGDARGKTSLVGAPLSSVRNLSSAPATSAPAELTLQYGWGLGELPVTKAQNDAAFTGGINVEDSVFGGDAARALRQLSTGGVSNVISANVSGGDQVTFVGALGGRDLPGMSCDGSNLVGASPPETCSVETTQQGSAVPGRVAKFNAAGTYLGDFVPAAGTYTADAIAVDRASDDVYVAGGNSHWAPINGQLTPTGPRFSVKRYDSAGSELTEIGLGVLGSSSRIEAVAETAPASFGVAVDPTTHRVFTSGPVQGGTPVVKRGVVRVFGSEQSVAVSPIGSGAGVVDADTGSIQECSKSSGVCTGSYVEGETVVLTAVPGAHSEVTGWTGCSAQPSPDECEVIVGQTGSNVGVSFDLIKRTVTVTPNGNGSGTVDADSGAISNCSSSGGTCAGSYGEGSTVTLTATPDVSSAVTWTGCNSEPSAEECEIDVPASNVAVTATFTLNQRALTIAKSGSGASTVTCDSGSGFGPCASSYDDGTQIAVKAEPANANSAIASVSGTGSASSCSASPCTFTITQASTVNVQANLISRALTVEKTGNGDGAITCKVGAGSFGACAATYDSGTQLTVHVSPDSNSSFGGFDGSSGSASACSGTSDCTFTITAATNIKVPLTLISRALTVEKTGNGDGTITCKVGAGSFGACAATYDSGTQLAVHVAPDSNSSFGGFDGSTGSASSCAGTGDCMFTITAATNIKVPLTLIPRSLTITKSGSGDGAITCKVGTGSFGACASTYDSGTQLTVQATPTLHSSFGGFSGSNGSAATCTTSPCSFTITAASTVKATFTLISHQLKVKVGGDGSGIVDADSGAIAGCSGSGGTCGGSYIEGTTVTLTATPGSHSNLAWSGCTAQPTANQCEITVSSDIEVSAAFSLRTHPLTVQKTGSGSGSISCDGLACAPSYPEGTEVTLSAAGDASSEFKGWSGAGCLGTAACTVTIDAPTAVSAAFDAKPVPSCATDPALCPKKEEPKKPLKCKKGFKKKKVKGKFKCVKVKKKKKGKR